VQHLVGRCHLFYATEFLIVDIKEIDTVLAVTTENGGILADYRSASIIKRIPL